jgi:hypothetical protein
MDWRKWGHTTSTDETKTEVRIHQEIKNEQDENCGEKDVDGMSAKEREEIVREWLFFICGAKVYYSGSYL